MPESKTFMLYRGDGKKDSDNVGVFTVTAEKLKVATVSQFLDLRDAEGNCVGTLTWPSTVKIREVGK